MAMGILWIFSVFCLSGMIHVHCQTSDYSVQIDDVMKDLLDFELESLLSSENVMADQPGYPEPSNFSETPELHTISLRPSFVRALRKIEERVPITTEMKYEILDNLLDSINLFALGLPLYNCSSKLKWLNLMILGANLVESKLKSEGRSTCSVEVSSLPDPSRFGFVLPENPCPSASTSENPCQSPSTEGPGEEPCEGSVTTEKPCLESTPESEYTDSGVPFVGSVRGIPGVHYPDYAEVPITNFSCADKKVPGFYADLDTGCQVFHVCYEHRRESFLCPIGTIFNQPILACDYWYSSNCSLAPLYYDTIKKDGLNEESLDTEVEDIVSVLINSETETVKNIEKTEDVLEEIAPFFPVKAVVTEFKPDKTKVAPVKPKSEHVDLLASDIFDRLIASATKATAITREAIGSIPEPEDKYKPDQLEKPSLKSKVPFAKAKMAAAFPVGKGLGIKAAIPVVAKKAKIAGALPATIAKAKLAATVPIAAKAKIAAALPVVATKAKVAAALPAKIAKAKLVASVPIAAKAKVAVAVPAKIAKAKLAATLPIAAKAKVAAIPAAKLAVATSKLAAVSPLAAKAKILPKVAIKGKMMASSVPLAKAKILAPVVKGKMIKGAGAPLLKAKMLGLPLAKSKLAGSIPLAKVKLAKAAAISPLTKKALALGYMKLLKAKKLALMG